MKLLLFILWDDVVRNVKGQVILYADDLTGSMERAIKEIERRRKIQLDYHKKYNIIPHTIQKEIQNFIYID